MGPAQPGDFGYKAIAGSYWSLAVELKFYLLVAVSYFFFRERFWVGVVIWPVIYVLLNFSFPQISGYLLHMKYFPFFVAGMAGWYFLFERDVFVATILTCVAIGLYVWVSNDLVIEGTSITSISLFVGANVFLLFVAIHSGPKSWLLPLAAIGRWSYSIYLIHEPLGVTIVSALRGINFPDGVSVTLTIGLMIVLGWILFTFVEQPGGRLLTSALGSNSK